MSNEWEYDDFGFDLNQEIGSTGKFVSYNDLVQHTWSEIRPQLLDNIQSYLDEGWEPITQIGPDCMIVETGKTGFLGGTKIYLKGIRIKMRKRRTKN